MSEEQLEKAVVDGVREDVAKRESQPLEVIQRRIDAVRDLVLPSLREIEGTVLRFKDNALELIGESQDNAIIDPMLVLLIRQIHKSVKQSIAEFETIPDKTAEQVVQEVEDKLKEQVGAQTREAVEEGKNIRELDKSLN